MANFNTVLNLRRAKKDGSYPIVFRTSFMGQAIEISSGYSCKKELFNQNGGLHKKDETINELLYNLKKHYQNRINEYKITNIGKWCFKECKEFILINPKKEITIYDFWEREIEIMMKIGKLGNARTYKITLSSISNYINLKIPFEKLKPNSIMELERRLLQQKVSINGVSFYLRTFRAICNKAINQELIGIEWYPFKKFKIKKEKTTPRVLTQDEIYRYFHLDLTSKSTLLSSWKIGKLIFMLRGINLRDLLILSNENIKGDRIIYKRSKTGKICSILLTNEIKQLLFSFKSDGFTLLGVLSKENIMNTNNFNEIYHQKRKIVNAHLKKIGLLLNTSEPLSTYVFRYTYANTAKRLGYSKDLISEALSHSYGNNTTSIYLEQFDLCIIDEMNQKIIEKVA
jgi:integrase/recombinase XerD